MKFFRQHSQSVFVVTPGHLGDKTIHLGDVFLGKNVDKDDYGNDDGDDDADDDDNDDDDDDNDGNDDVKNYEPEEFLPSILQHLPALTA